MKLFQFAVLAMMAASLSSASAAEDKPIRGGTLLWGLSAEAGTLDCGATDTYAVIQTVAPFYSTLLKLDLDKYGQIKGDLAKTWKISEDGKTYTFDLHPNVKFHDGSPLTSADVKATYDRYRYPPAGVVSFRMGSLFGIDTIETPSPTTVVFKLRAANSAMLLNLASPHGCIYSAKKLAENPRYPATNVMGSGPFKLVEYAKGKHIIGARFDDYFQKGLPYLDGFKAIIYSQTVSMLNGLLTGQIMGEFRTVTQADRSLLQAALGDTITFYRSDWSTNLVLVFNTRKKPFDDIRVRQALSMALDRYGVSLALRNTSIVRAVGGLVRPGAPFSTDPVTLTELPGFARNGVAAKEKAKELLKEAGVENLKFELFNRTVSQPYSPLGVFLVSQWRQIDVEVAHNQVDTPVHREGLRQGNFDVAIDFVNAALEDPTLTLTKYLSPDISQENLSGHIDREADALFEMQARETDQARREELVHGFEKRVISQAAQTPLLWFYRIVPLYTRVKGWKISHSHIHGQDFAEVWLAPED
jgi:peptide/nickel transport system substrate-binding protein